jgi:hypothetical protein
MAAAAVPSVEALCVDAIQLSHSNREVGLRCFDQQVVVVAHQAVGVAEPGEAVDDAGERCEEGGPVVGVEIDVLASVAARDQVVETIGDDDSQGTRHARNLGSTAR